jgi:hypothetical protein
MNCTAGLGAFLVGVGGEPAGRLPAEHARPVGVPGEGVDLGGGVEPFQGVHPADGYRPVVAPAAVGVLQHRHEGHRQVPASAVPGGEEPAVGGLVALQHGDGDGERDAVLGRVEGLVGGGALRGWR